MGVNIGDNMRPEKIICGHKITSNNDKYLDDAIEFMKHKTNVFGQEQSESDLRRYLSIYVAENASNYWLLCDGNNIWDVKKLTRQFSKLLKNYNIGNLTNYLYEFFHLQCGSIAHYNKSGWFDEYSNKNRLKQFFQDNEYGQPVRDYSPHWHYDVREAQTKMADILSV